MFSFLHLTEVDPVCPYAKMNFRKRVVVTDSQHTDLLLLKEHCILNEVKQECNLIMLLRNISCYYNQLEDVSRTKANISEGNFKKLN